MPIEEITVDELAEHLAMSNGTRGALIDVREPHEYVAGHVAGAILIPLSEFGDRLGEIPDAQPLHIICRSGARSMRAAEALASTGIAAVNVSGGTLGWIDSGRPLVVGPDRG